MTAFAVSLAAGKLVPALTDETAWPYVVIGFGFAVLGVVFIAYGAKRMRAVDAALEHDGYERPDARVLALLTAAGVVLGLGLAAIVAFSE